MKTTEHRNGNLTTPVIISESTIRNLRPFNDDIFAIRVEGTDGKEYWLGIKTWNAGRENDGRVYVKGTVAMASPELFDQYKLRVDQHASITLDLVTRRDRYEGNVAFAPYETNYDDDKRPR